MGSEDANGKKEEEEEEEDNKLVAVIIASGTLCNTFYPATQDCPLALLPVVNNPLISYSFEWLRRNKVDEIIIYCNRKDAREINTFCRKWSNGNGDCMKLIVLGCDSFSLGDAMRDLCNKSLVKKDFILLDGFVVGNTNLQKALRRHKEFVKVDPNCIMTCLYQRRSPGPAGIKPRCLDNVRMAHLLVNSVTSRILNHYRPVKPSTSSMPARMFCSSPRIRTLSVEDPYIGVCSEKVPMMFFNRRYNLIDSFIQDVLHQDQTLKYNLRAYVPNKGNMMLVSSLRAFQELSLLLVKRWFCPLVPEKCLASQNNRYKFDDENGNYYDESALIRRKDFGRENVIGQKSEIDEECTMNNTVVGKRCLIRGKVTITNSLLMDNVTIGNECVVENCFIGKNVRLFPGVHLEPGVILGPDTKLGPSVKVHRHTRVISSPPEVLPVVLYSPIALPVVTPETVTDKPPYVSISDLYPFRSGSEGEGKAFKVKVNDGIIEQEDLFGYGFQDLKWGEPPHVLNCLPSPSDSSSIQLEDMKPVLALDFSSNEQGENEFGVLVMESLLTAYKNVSKRRSIMYELNSSWNKYGINEENALRVIVKNAVHVVEKSDGESKLMGDKLFQRVSKGLMYFEDYIRRYIRNVENQLILLNLLEEIVCEEERYLTVIYNVFHQLSQELQLVKDEVIVFWYKNGGHGTPQFPFIAKKIKKLVELLEDASDDEDNVE